MSIKSVVEQDIETYRDLMMQHRADAVLHQLGSTEQHDNTALMLKAMSVVSALTMYLKFLK